MKNLLFRNPTFHPKKAHENQTEAHARVFLEWECNGHAQKVNLSQYVRRNFKDYRNKRLGDIYVTPDPE